MYIKYEKTNKVNHTKHSYDFGVIYVSKCGKRNKNLDAGTRDSEETFFCFWWKRNPNILVTMCFLKNSLVIDDT